MRGTEAEKAKAAEEAEKRIRHIFWGSLLLSTLIVVEAGYIARASGGWIQVLQGFLPPMLLWSIIMTAYAFYTFSRISLSRLRQLAPFTDAVTGVFTLNYLQSYLETARKRAYETNQSAIVGYLDLVNLERVNGSAGHAVGDIVLKAVAQLIAGHLRGGDIVGRVGGDEFLIIMPETTVAEAQPVIESIVEAIRGYRLDLGKKGVVDFLNCKSGLAVFPSDGESPEDIMAAAREHLK